MTENTLDLRFGPGSPSGFTPSGVAGFSDLRPAAVVRELIQNSLDAAVEADTSPAIVQFLLSECKTIDIPGIKAYRQAFRSAVKTHRGSVGGQLASQADRVVRTIERATKRKKQDVMYVLDNGIGLNCDRMTALLSDGVSAKAGGATGTFGNGHTVAIPASDLRYVLYGGLTASGARIGAGHAVLASARVDNQPHQSSGDGFLIERFLNGGFEYAHDSAVPLLISDPLDEIENKFGHGTVVVIPAFNHFREHNPRPLWEAILRAAACNFFQAIEEDRLVIVVENRKSGTDSSIRLDSSTLSDVLEKYRDEKRSQSFLSGSKAFEALSTLRSGRAYVVPTSAGSINICIAERKYGVPRVDLCRNGMWITDDKQIPSFYYKFRDKAPFHALLMLDSQTVSGQPNNDGCLHELVRNAEGPLHDRLDANQRLPKGEALQLRRAFIEIREWIRGKVPTIGVDSYSPDDFLALDFAHSAANGSAKRSFWGFPVAIARHDPSFVLDTPRLGPGGPRNPGHGSPPSSTPRSRPALRSILRAVAIRIGSNRLKVHIECDKSCENAELRLCVDQNLDATCDNVNRSELEAVGLSDVTIDGQMVPQELLSSQDGKVIGVLLGSLSPNSVIDLEMSYNLPENLSSLREQQPTLRVEVFAKSVVAKGGKVNGQQE